MTEAERLAELERLIEEQRRDDTSIVYPESPSRDQVFLDAPFAVTDGDVAAGFSGLIGVDPEGEIVSFIRERRGTILVGSATWHGTYGGYTNHGCRCKRCRKAHSERCAAYQRERRRNRPPGVCPVCGEEFVQFADRQYCSTICQERASGRRRRGLPIADPVVECAGCGESFKARHLRQRFCTQTCGDRHRQREHRRQLQEAA